MGCNDVFHFTIMNENPIMLMNLKTIKWIHMRLQKLKPLVIQHLKILFFQAVIHNFECLGEQYKLLCIQIGLYDAPQFLYFIRLSNPQLY